MYDKSENLEIGFEIQCHKCEKIGFTSNAKGWTYEPSFFYEKNEAAIALEKSQTIKHRAQVQQNSPVVSKSIPTYAE